LGFDPGKILLRRSCDVKIENVIESRIVRRLDESGFIDKAYAAQGISAK